MRVLAKEILRPRIKIGKVAAPPARDADFFAGRFRVVKHQRARTSMGRAHHPGRAGPQNDRFELHNAAMPYDPEGVKGLSAFVSLVGC